MREFKFIRGKYTDENIFNSDETKACLFAYDSEGNLVQFTEKNNKEFQDKFARLSSDDRLSEIYTLRPSQFNVSAVQTSSGFDFTYKADPTAFNNDVQIPEVVRNKAESHIKSNTEVTFDTGDKHLPILNFMDSSNVKTPTTFKFNDNNNSKEFSKNLIFKITGKVKERGYTTAQGEYITAYPVSDGIIDFGGETGTNAKSGTFYQGVWQKIAATKTGTIYKNAVTVSANGSLTLAKSYKAGSGLKFIKDGKFETDIPYQDDLSFKLYSGVDGYLTAVEAKDAVSTIKTFAIEGNKYKINSDDDYELYSSASADDSVKYYLIQDGSSASATKLRKSNSSPEKYSVISGNDYYFVDNTKPEDFSSFGFNDIGKYITAANNSSKAVNLTETKSVGANKVAFIKYNDIWHYANSNVAIIPKFYKTVGGKKVYLSSIKKDGDTYILTGDNYKDIVAKELISNEVYGTDYYYGEILLTDYCQFTADAAASQAKFINFNSLDKIVSKTGITEGVDYGNIYTPVEVVVNTSYKIKTGYVAYDKNETLTELIDGSQNQVYKRDEGIEATKIDSPDNYDFYNINSGTAYMLKGDCNVGTRANNQFVEGYAESYNSYFIFKNNKLSNISATDLTGKTTITYYENNNHNIVGSGVYDDNDDGKRYVKFSDNNWVENIAINSKNTLVNEDNVPAPNTTENVLRFITEVNVNATQSD